ncbi:MAG: nucleoside kinase [Oscillospiraceae bacterium]|nr:nucleoside kinase [Oscillospiraceae bacterium]
MVKFASIASINREANDPERLIKLSEDNYSAYIAEAAQRAILSDKPIILLSGPSGSGKTSAALRLEKCLKEQGRAAHTLSMDNYFLPIDEESAKELPRDEEGNIDLESPLRLDIPLFSEHLRLLAAGEEFDMPRFDFTTQSRSGSVKMARKKNETVIIEGIHALNPTVTGDTHKFAMCMYVSVRTRLKAADGSLLHPRHIRLMRRLCRDKLFRKRRYEESFKMFSSVSRGEDLYITPYKPRADFDIDTFIAYEASVYRNFLLDELSAQKDSELARFPACQEILKFLQELDPVAPEYVPTASMIREFIGGSELKY